MLTYVNGSSSFFSLMKRFQQGLQLYRVELCFPGELKQDLFAVWQPVSKLSSTSDGACGALRALSTSPAPLPSRRWTERAEPGQYSASAQMPPVGAVRKAAWLGASWDSPQPHGNAFPPIRGAGHLLWQPRKGPGQGPTICVPLSSSVWGGHQPFIVQPNTTQSL